MKSSRNPVIVNDRDWEGSGPYLYGSVLFDPKDRLFKAWYTVSHEDEYRKGLPGSYMACYATSRDGYTWEKPVLGLWKPPFRIEVTGALHGGANDLDLRVVNLWPNRLIGDDHLPEDTEWAGSSLCRWPQWPLEGKPSRTGRLTFTTWKHWTKDDPLLESGLLGPVTLETAQQIEVGR
ncbi:MAG: hypothetical protein ACKV22_04815 [Bryobacteraceae bacterium]